VKSLAAALGLFLCTPAPAQPRADDLYVNPTLLVSSSRLTAMAGASVAIGESAEGMATNYAAVAQRSPRRFRRWDFDATFSLLATPIDSQKDFENDSRPQTSAQPIEGQAGLYLQYLKFGLGGFGRVSSRNLCLSAACDQKLLTTTMHGGLVAGAAFFEDQLVVAVGFNVTSARFTYRAEDVGYSGTSFGVGGLLRLHRLPFRLGASFCWGTSASRRRRSTRSPTGRCSAASRRRTRFRWAHRCGWGQAASATTG
jgi:hypothetical protein